jgi:hypothetical protein
MSTKLIKRGNRTVRVSDDWPHWAVRGKNGRYTKRQWRQDRRAALIRAEKALDALSFGSAYFPAIDGAADGVGAAQRALRALRKAMAARVWR